MEWALERLGFRVDLRSQEHQDNYAGVRRDDVSLHMQWQHPQHFEDGTAARLRVRIRVDDPDALYEEFKAPSALSPGTAVRDTDWGTREFGFRDPDGNGLIFYRELRSVTSQFIVRAAAPGIAAAAS